MPGAGLGGSSLPPISVQVNVDDSALARTGATAGGVGKQIESGLGVGKKASSALESGLSNLAAQFGISLPPEVRKSASALIGLASTSGTVRAEVSALGSGVKGLAGELGISVPPQAEKSAIALKGLASSGIAANAAVGLASGTLVVVEEDLAKTGATAGAAGEQLKDGLEAGNKAAETLHKGLSGVAKGGEEASEGIGLATGAAIVGVAALTAVVVAAKSGVDTYLELASKVEDYQRVTGETAPEASREVQAFEILGVSAETAAAGVYKLSKNIETAPAKLQALGIEVARNSDGNVELEKTLENVADAYVHAGSAEQKNLILQTAFGRGGRDMIPILEQGAAGLRELEQAVGIVMSQEDIDRAREYKIHVQEAKSAWDAFTASIGEKVVPALDAEVEAMNRANYVSQKMDEAQAAHGNTTEFNRVAQMKLAQQYGAEFDAAQKASEAAQLHAQKLQAEADAAAKLVKQEEDLISQLSAEWTTTQKLDNANIELKESADKIVEAQVRVRDAARSVSDAQKAYTQAVREYGPHSAEAKAAADALTLAQIAARKAADEVTKAQDDQYTAYLNAAGAARDQQAATDLATGGAKDATKETEKYIDTLQAEANTLDVNSPLRKKLQEYIDQLKSKVPSEVTTKYIIDYIPIGEGPGGHGTQHFASGGRPPLNQVSEVGEDGVEIFTPDEPDRPQLLIGTKGPQPFLPPEPGVITAHGQIPPGRPVMESDDAQPMTAGPASASPASDYAIGMAHRGFTNWHPTVGPWPAATELGRQQVHPSAEVAAPPSRGVNPSPAPAFSFAPDPLSPALPAALTPGPAFSFAAGPLRKLEPGFSYAAGPLPRPSPPPLPFRQVGSGQAGLKIASPAAKAPSATTARAIVASPTATSAAQPVASGHVSIAPPAVAPITPWSFLPPLSSAPRSASPGQQQMSGPEPDYIAHDLLREIALKVGISADHLGELSGRPMLSASAGQRRTG